jgi:photosynthetic reaction center cytochrome c subunit
MKLGVYWTGAAFVGFLAVVLLTIAMLFTSGWTRPPVLSSQNGFRGTGMAKLASPGAARALKLANVLPDAIDKASPDGQRATEAYQNVQVLTDISADQFNRVMLALAAWVAPTEGDNAGCAYCHDVNNMADDSLYTKKVARRMIQMTRHINTDWKTHVAVTGVTCYTCHRGMPVPANIWFDSPGPPHAGGFSATNDWMGHPASVNGRTALPLNALQNTLDGEQTIRVEATQALPTGYGASIQLTDQTYSLMIHMSESLGVNCTFCHNTRAISQWAQSTPQRVTAWHGIRLARDLNTNYLDPLKATFPANRLGPLGDSPKVNCATCHQGANKPLLGVSMAKDYPELGGTAAP